MSGVKAMFVLQQGSSSLTSLPVVREATWEDTIQLTHFIHSINEFRFGKYAGVEWEGGDAF